MVELTLADPLRETTRCTSRAMAKLCWIGVVSVQRIWKAHRLTPHRMHTFKLSKDPTYTNFRWPYDAHATDQADTGADVVPG